MRATVVIPARDAAALIGAALDAVAAQQAEFEFDVVVVDNGSLDSTAEIAERHRVGARVVRRARGEGPGAARNDGVAASTGEVIAFTDADCRPAPGWLTAGVRAIEGRAIVQGAVAPSPGVPVGPFDHTVSIGGEYGLYETANLFVRRGWFERVGGFEDFIEVAGGRPFGEDAWFAWRVRRAGGEAGFAAEALVHHAVIGGDVRDWIGEHARLRHFPELVRRIPELRATFLFGHWFLTRRSFYFNCALNGVVLALLARRPLALLLAAPYARDTFLRARSWPRPARFAAAQLAADAVAAGALAAGSVRARTPVL